MQFKSKIVIAAVLVIIVTLISIIAYPYLNSLFLADNEPFTEIWILGPEHTGKNYPQNMVSNNEYAIYLGVGNQLNENSQYSIRVLLDDDIEKLFSSSAGNFNPIANLHEFDFQLSDEEVWETKLIFAFDYVPINENLTRIENVRINEAIIPVNHDLVLDVNRNGFYSILLFELWNYDETINTFVYDNQVHLQLNMTLT